MSLLECLIAMTLGSILMLVSFNWLSQTSLQAQMIEHLLTINQRAQLVSAIFEQRSVQLSRSFSKRMTQRQHIGTVLPIEYRLGWHSVDRERLIELYPTLLFTALPKQTQFLWLNTLVGADHQIDQSQSHHDMLCFTTPHSFKIGQRLLVYSADQYGHYKVLKLLHQPCLQLSTNFPEHWRLPLQAQLYHSEVFYTANTGRQTTHAGSVNALYQLTLTNHKNITVELLDFIDALHWHSDLHGSTLTIDALIRSEDIVPYGRRQVDFAGSKFTYNKPLLLRPWRTVVPGRVHASVTRG